MQITKECWDGTEIVTHTMINGSMMKTGLECPPKPSDRVLAELK